MAANKLTILFAPVDGYGHFNACIGLAEPLRDRGNKVVFAVPNGWKGKLIALGFEEEWYSTEGVDAESQTAVPSAQGLEMIQQMADAMAMSPEDQIKSIIAATFPEGFMRMVVNSEETFKSIVKRVKPDVIVIDMIFTQPALTTAGIPWILCCSCNPLLITKDENVPPAFSGLPTTGSQKDWKRFEQRLDSELLGIFDAHNSWVIANGGEPLRKNLPLFINQSPYANIYMCPTELDYTELRPVPPKWHRFETFVRSSNEHFAIPDQLKDLPGRLVYFSMGSMGSAEVGLMKKLVGILGKSPHRFIVSKGHHGDKFELPSNMWGANTLPQTKVIPLVDLVITHGGNNTVTESFYFGKPCIVLPLFADQHDNAQRVLETGCGARFSPYHLSEEELLVSVEKILADEELRIKTQSISKRIQAANSQALAADLIEKVARREAV